MKKKQVSLEGQKRDGKYFKCMLCNHVVRSWTGISTHLKHYHKGAVPKRGTEKEGPKQGRNWCYTNDAPTPKRKYKKKSQEGPNKFRNEPILIPIRRKGKHLKCLLCGHIVGTRSGIKTHFNYYHKNETAKAVENWIYTNEPTTPKKRTNQKRKYSKKGGTDLLREHGKKQIPILKPGTTIIDVPVLLRVPVLIGTAEIISLSLQEQN